MLTIMDFYLTILRIKFTNDIKVDTVNKYIKNDRILRKYDTIKGCLQIYYTKNKTKILNLFVSVRKYIFTKYKELNDIDDGDEILIYEKLKEKHEYYTDFFLPTDYERTYASLFTLFYYNQEELGIDINKLFNDYIEKKPIMVSLNEITFIDDQNVFIQYLKSEETSEICVLTEELHEKIIDFFSYLNNE